MTGSNGKKKTAGRDDKRPDGPRKRRNPWLVDNIESLVVAVVLALIIRTFVVEAFVIPTGSMALSLHGNHFNVTCPNCDTKYTVGFNPDAPVVPERTLCPNCGERAPGLQSYSPGMPVPDYAGGDRILVNKVLYRFEPARRWDPFVFVNPNAAAGGPGPPKTTYIKRLTGLPGETLEILRGDVVVDGQVQRKPAAAQSRLWMPVYDGRRPWRRGQPWRMTGTGWRLEGRRLAADCPGADFVWATYAGRPGVGDGTIRDTYAYDHDLGVARAPYIDRGAGLNVVTDVRVTFDVTPGATGRLRVALPRDDEVDHVTLDFDKGRAQVIHEVPVGDTTEERLVGGAELKHWSTDRTHHVSFYRLDYMLVLVIDGETLVEYDLWRAEGYDAYRELAARGREYSRLLREGRDPAPNEAVAGYRKSGVRIGAAGGRLELADLRIDRDVYYTSPGQRASGGNHYVGPTQIPQGYCFAMGDNSPESYDSRYWGLVPAENLIGKGLVIWWHPLRTRLIH